MDRIDCNMSIVCKCGHSLSTPSIHIKTQLSFALWNEVQPPTCLPYDIVLSRNDMWTYVMTPTNCMFQCWSTTRLSCQVITESLSKLYLHVFKLLSIINVKFHTQTHLWVAKIFLAKQYTDQTKICQTGDWIFSLFLFFGVRSYKELLLHTHTWDASSTCLLLASLPQSLQCVRC